MITCPEIQAPLPQPTMLALVLIELVPLEKQGVFAPTHYTRREGWTLGETKGTHAFFSPWVSFCNGSGSTRGFCFAGKLKSLGSEVALEYLDS